MMSPGKLACGSVLAASCLTGGCAPVDKLFAPSLSGTPATSSLVVVVCEATMLGVFDLRTRQKVEFGVLVGKGGYGRFVGRAVSNLMVFSDVPAGEWSLTGVQTTWVAGNTSYTHSYHTAATLGPAQRRSGSPS